MTNNPFVAAGRIEKLCLFHGYKEELSFIAHLMAAAQPTSINVYGEKRIGKSSLLYHFYLTWAQRIDLKLRDNFAVIYLSLQESGCCDESQFYQAIAKKLSVSHSFQRAELRDIWQSSEWTRQKFKDAVELCKRFNILPVLCLDDVETALKNDKAFDEGFYNNLRFLMGSNALMLVIATFKPVNLYKKEYGLSSLFFNQGQNLHLEGFTEKAVDRLMQVADSVSMSEEEQLLIRQWGGNNPYKLQLAGTYLFEARRREKDVHWAKQQFDERLSNLKSSSQSAFWKNTQFFLNGLGKLAKKVTKFLNKWRMTIAGAIVIALIALTLLDIMSIKQLVAALVGVFAISGIFSQ